jgi:heptosyltransferase-3
LWQYKEWGIEKYVELIHQIKSIHDFPIIITGSPDEKLRADRILRDSPLNVYNFAGKTSIGMFAALLKSCDLFIGVDSAGIHIAGAVGTPTVSIFGPSSPASWAPKGKQHIVVSKDLFCVPCREKGCQGKEVSRCLEELTPKEVMLGVKYQFDNILNNKIKAF